jgi:hypothetical protein
MTKTTNTMAEDNNDKEDNGIATPTGTVAETATALPGEKTELSVEVTAKNEVRHVFDLRVEFASDARNAVDTFSVVPAVKNITNRLLATNEVQILSRNGTSFFTAMTDFPKTSDEFNAFFETDQKQSGSKARVWTRIKITSTLNFWSLKQHGFMHGYLRENHIYIHQHLFETLPITDIGILLFKSPEHTFRQDFTKTLRRIILVYFSALSITEVQALQYDINELDLANNDLPLFEITSKKQVKFTFKNTDAEGNITQVKESTIALKIMCETKEKQRLGFLLTEATRHSKFASGLFIGYAEKNQNPQACQQAI